MATDPNYLSNTKPDFTPFEIDCGKIPAFTYKGDLKSELADKRIMPDEAIELLENMLNEYIS